ncbi:MAG: agmatine deiminase, partial [Lachnospira sp.]|nr:agmatine deiminase [Lachnospira sp.]
MNILKTTPASDNFRMPAEYETHHGCLMIWPERPGSWIYGANKAQKVFAEIAAAISESEQLYMLVSKAQLHNAKQLLPGSVNIIEMESDDAWARDTGPTFVVSGEYDTPYNKRILRGINWEFNAWGGDFDGLYADWTKDNLIAKNVLNILGCDCYDAAPFVLEGGSIHSDGQGTLMVTESCLLSKGRNPKLTKAQIEDTLKQYLNVSKIIWLPSGIYNDETNEHVDNVCAFTAPGEVVLAWTDDVNDPQYKMSKACLEVLNATTDACGRNIHVRKLPIPANPVCITEYELNGFTFEAGEDMREAGERLAASYVNFYIANDAVIVPQFDDINDSVAVSILSEAFPDRKIVPVYARDIIVGGGNIH